MKILTGEELKKLLHKPKRKLKFNEVVFLLERKMKEMEKRVAVLEAHKH